MNRKVYDFLNDMDMDLNRYEKKELSEFEKKKYKKDISEILKKTNEKLNNKSNSWRKRIVVIAASIIFLFGFSQTKVGKDTYVMASELFANIKYGIKEGLGFVDDIDKYSSRIDLISESEGVKLKLNDVIVDRDKIYFSLLVDVSNYVSKEDLGDTNNNYFVSILDPENKNVTKMTIANKEIEMFSSKTSIGFSSLRGKDNGDLEEINYKEKGILDIIIKADNPLEDEINNLEKVDFNLDFDYLGINIWKESPSNSQIEEIPGDWNFEFTRNIDELLINTDRSKLDENLALDDLKIEFIELTSNPLGNKIEAKVEDKGLYKEEFGTSIILDGYDNLGQRRSFDFILDEGENTIMIEEFYNHIDFPQVKSMPDNNYPESNINFKDIEFIEFTPYYKREEKGSQTKWESPITGASKLGDSFKIYLNGK